MIVSEGKTAQSARAWGWKGVGGEGNSKSRQRVRGFSSENPEAFSRTSNREKQRKRQRSGLEECV